MASEIVWSPDVIPEEICWGVPVSWDESLDAATAFVHQLERCWFCMKLDRIHSGMAGDDVEPPDDYPWHPFTPEDPRV